MDIFIPHGLQCYLIGHLASQTFYELYITFFVFFLLFGLLCLFASYICRYLCKLILVIPLYTYDNIFQTINRSLPEKVHMWAKPVALKSVCPSEDVADITLPLA
jgi:hypothetical protein